ncbi:MAG TPA: glycosyltransferase family 39 protein [Thermoanaerobaculia bacterium]|nr:glycosyltransferase family 39 protein [Thermoanaerobaculia bacterium]
MNRRSALVASLFVALAVARVTATYTHFSQTYDEPVHVAMGLEWLDRGTYTLELQHPPLARIFDALSLRIAGEHYPPGPIVLTDPAVSIRKGNAILGGPDDYQRNLTLARIGVLPWLLLAAFVVFHWTRAIANTESAVAAVALFTFVPAILGHAGLATTDMALAATLPAAVYALVRCIERPSAGRTALFACALAAAVLSKFSAIPFMVVIGGVVLLLKLRENGPDKRVRPTFVAFAIAIPIAALIVWAAYRFSLWPASLYGFPPNELLAMLAEAKAPPDRALFFLLSHFRLPAPELFAGLAHLGEHTLFGHPSYFLGQIRTHGVWYFFPVVIAVKTPIAFLILAILGARRASIPVLSAAAIVVIAMVSRINLGVRHVLPIYPLLAIAGGIALIEMWQRRRIVAPTIAIVLGAWMAVSSLLAHPDYIAYFNELAGRHPERIVVDSDLDWGQDLPRLRDAIVDRRIDRLWIVYFGSTDLSRYPLAPAIRGLPPRTRVNGWIAISKTSLKGAYGQPDDYAWLERLTPVQEIGRSILLYHSE